MSLFFRRMTVINIYNQIRLRQVCHNRLFHCISFFPKGSVTSTDSGLGFYDHRITASGQQRIHNVQHHPQKITSPHGKTISANGKLISVAGNNSNSASKGPATSYQLASSSSIKEQRKQQQALLQQQRQQRKFSTKIYSKSNI